MPDEPKAPDPFDIGNTDFITESQPEETPSSSSEVTEPTPVASSPDRPRNADGTFAPTKPAHPAWLLEQAADCGLPESEAQEMSSAAIGRYCRNVLREQAKLREQFATQKTVQEGQVREEDLGISWGVDEEGKPLSETDFHPGLAGVIKQQAKKIKDLEARDIQREVSRSQDLIDAAFDALGEGYVKMFGTGTAQEIAENDRPALRRRIAILNEAGINMRQLPTNLKAKIKAAAELLYPVSAPKETKAEEPNPYETGKNGVNPKEWAEGGLARPTQRKGAPEPDGDAKARRNVARKLREQDMGPEHDQEVLDGLL